MTKELLIQVVIGLVVLTIIIVATVLIVGQMGTIYDNLPPPNSTRDWKMILENDKCHWYELGCQRLACVIDCQEINKNAGEKICVC